MQIAVQAMIFAAVIGLTAKTYQIVFTARQKMTCSAAMLAAMICGSMAGLITGMLLAMHQSYSMNSVLAMIAGIGAGFIIGLPFNAMAMLDGILAGVMGGLMGAMMGDMLTASFIVPLSLVLLAIFALCTVVLSVAAKQEPESTERALLDKRKVRNLSIVAVSVTIVLFAGVLAGSMYGKYSSDHSPAPVSGRDPAGHLYHHLTE